MARSPDELLRIAIGDLVVQVTLLRAENEALKAALEANPVRVPSNGTLTSVARPGPECP
jgi:hypothetical protein